MKIDRRLRASLLVLFFSALGFLVMGYHPGAEDDEVYLTSVKSALNPALYPHDGAFFKLQMQNSLFDPWMAHFVRLSGIPLDWAELLGQVASLVVILWACWSILRLLFADDSAQWAGVAAVSAMLTLPVAGTALYILDQYLHPRNPAAALILVAVYCILAGHRWRAIPLLLAAFCLHPLMAVFGVSFSVILALCLEGNRFARLRGLSRRFTSPVMPAVVLIPFGWVFSPPSPIWQEALRSRHWFSLYRWEWYEWLGAVAPLLILAWVARVAGRRGEAKLAGFAAAVAIYGSFQMALSMAILSPLAPIGLTTLEPMRFLQLVYVFLAMIGGAYLGRYILRAHLWRWGTFLLLASGGMLVAQRQLFPSTPHLELPSQVSPNPWIQAFSWIKDNTPVDAYFTVDPLYMSAPGNDNHGFRALAERSVLADAIKDTAVVTKVPDLAPEWKREVEAQKGWKSFQLGDFERLKSQFGVDWVLEYYPQPKGLDCKWHNDTLAVCKIP
jgi:hypothetical protein